MKKYIDCDGVILNTIDGLFNEYNTLKKVYPELDEVKYLNDMDWEDWIEQKGPLYDSFNVLKNYDPKDIDILTRVHSLNEAVAKIEYFRKNNIRNSVIIVPLNFKKSQIVTAFENILVDDDDKNLIDWQENFGIPFYFGNKESEFEKINSLDEILNPKKLEKRLNDKRKQFI